MKRAAIFLDRDGTINFDSGYVRSEDQLQIFPAARSGLKILAGDGYSLFIVTNQSGLARGFLTRTELNRIHRRLVRELGRDGIKIAEIAVCPHHPEDKCECRKPSPRLVRRLARKFRLDLARSFFIGDKNLDVQTGRNAGCRTVLLAAPENLPRLRREADWIAPDLVAPDLYAAAVMIARLSLIRKAKE